MRSFVLCLWYIFYILTSCSAFVAASRRKDRSLDARLESANRASMLHKKRTGKALHITKEIVEREAMYEEVDERYQEKRMKLLKAHTSELEAQFQRHLVAAMAYGANVNANVNLNINANANSNANSNNRSSFGRLSQGGGIQKMRIDVAAAQSYFPERSQQQSLSPTTPSSIKGDPTSPTFGGSYSSPAESYVQTPGSYYMPTTQQFPSYISQQQMSAFMPQQLNTSSWDSTNQFLALQQSVNALETSQGQMASMAQMTSQSSQPIRQRVASVPDVLLFQQQYMNSSVPDVSRAQSEPFTPSPLADNNHEDHIMPALTDINKNNTGLSPPPMTSYSSQSSSGDNQSPVLGQDSLVHVDKEAILGMSEVLDTNFDPEYTDFFDFSTTLEDQWQMPMADPCYEDWGHLENVDYELAVSGI